MDIPKQCALVAQIQMEILFIETRKLSLKPIKLLIQIVITKLQHHHQPSQFLATLRQIILWKWQITQVIGGFHRIHLVQSTAARSEIMVVVWSILVISCQ